MVRRALLTCGIALLSARTLSAQSQVSINSAPPGEPVNVTAGAAVTVAISNGPGNVTDWIGLYSVGTADGAFVDWRYLNGTTVPPSSGLTDATITFYAPVAPGEYEMRVFASNGYDRLATSGVVTVTPSSAHLSVNGTDPPTAVSIAAGGHAAVQVTNGPGNAGDWIGLFAAAADDHTYVSWKYLNGTTALPGVGTSAAALTFAVPTAAGSYELRFFANNGFARLATSTTLVVEASTAQLAVNGIAPPTGVTVAAGSVAVVSVSGGPTNVGDWVALYAVGAADNAYLDWRYLNDTAVVPTQPLSAATLHFTMPSTAGAYEFRFLADNGYGQLSTSSLVTVPVPTAQISVNGTAPPAPVSVSPGATLSVEVTGGPGNPTDWVALALSGSPDTAFLRWMYLNASTAPPNSGLTAATLNISVPAGNGSYELRFFANNGFGRLATSSAITASSTSTSPTVTVQLTDPFGGTTFNNPPAITLAATATAANGSVTRVDFYAGGSLVGTASSAPYQISWSGMTAGPYALTAVAVDNTGHATTSAPIQIAVGESGGSAGTLGIPIATPAAGSYAPNQTVSLAAANSATIHYTVDGSAPTVNSPTYSGALTLAGTTTVRAAAFENGWTPSTVLVAVYTIDGAPPVITTTLTPAPNAAGWNNGPVIASFACSDAASGVWSCPAPITFDHDGADQAATVTAVDLVGNRSTLSVVLNIDSVPGLISVSPVPETTTSSTVVVSGTTSDALSGIVRVTCNGILGTLNDDSFSCDVPLQAGRNSISVQVSDRAGNSSSTGFRVTRTGTSSTIAITPGMRSLLVGQSRALTAVGEFGLLTTSVNWGSSDPSVVSVSGNQITAVAEGNAVVTATVGQLSAQSSITVLSTIGYNGQPLWSLPPLQSGSSPSRIIRAPSLGPSEADVYMVETPADSQRTIVRGIDANGAQLYAEDAPGQPLFADVYGGMVAMTPADVEFGPIFGKGLARFAGPAELHPWRYESQGLVQLGAAQGPDGTVYLVELSPDYTNGFVVLLDGDTGAVKSRLTLPNQTTHLSGLCQGDGEGTGLVSGISVGADGAAYLEVVQRAFTYTCFEDAGSNYLTDSLKLLLVRVDPSGVAAITPIRQWQFSGVQGDWVSRYPFVGRVVPDSQGGLLASWFLYAADSPTGGLDVQVTRIKDGVAVEHVLSDRVTNVPVGLEAEWALPSPLILSGDSGTAVVKDASALLVVNVESWNTLWSLSADSTPLMATRGGGLSVQDSAGSLVSYDPTGTITNISALSLVGPTESLEPHAWEGLDTQSGALTTLSGPIAQEALYSFLALGGNVHLQGGSRLPSFTHIIPPTLLRLAPPYSTVQYAEDLRRRVLSGRPPLVFSDVEATVNTFLSEIAKKIDAFVFIGHSIEHTINGLHQSTGLQLYMPPTGPIANTQYYIQGTYPVIPPTYPGERAKACTVNDCPLSFVSVEPIPFRATVLFFGECEVSAVFRDLFGVPEESDSGPAMIVPKYPRANVDLKAAAFAWKNIAKRLLAGDTVRAAVDYANLAFLIGDPDTGEGFLEQDTFKVIGFKNATIR